MAEDQLQAQDIEEVGPKPAGKDDDFALKFDLRGAWAATSHGKIVPYGKAPHLGRNQILDEEVVAIASADGCDGYWILYKNGAVDVAGQARAFTDSTLGPFENAVDIFTVGTEGYILVNDQGAVRPAGNAIYYGSGLDFELSAPVVSATGNLEGYYLLTTSGRVLNFGNLPFYGSGTDIELEDGEHFIEIMCHPSYEGYWLVTNTGRVVSYGRAEFFGRPEDLDGQIAAACQSPHGDGYWMVTKNGTVKAFGAVEAFESAVDPSYIDSEIKSLAIAYF
jgi:hypothetical protein